MEKKTQVPQIKQKNIPILIFFRRQDLGKKKFFNSSRDTYF